MRGKTNAEVEFGAKEAISVVGGYALMEELSRDNFNEGTTLKKSIDNYHQRFGCYPEAVLAGYRRGTVSTVSSNTDKRITVCIM